MSNVGVTRWAERGGVCSAIAELKQRGYVSGGQQVAIVQSGKQPIWRAASTHAIQVILSADASPLVPIMSVPAQQ